MELTTQAAMVLIVAVVISVAYEAFRATARAGVSKYDSVPAFVRSVPLYIPILIVAGLVLTEALWAVWLALLLSVALIVVSIFYYSPVMLVARNPGWIDHLEDKVYTGLLFVAAALLIYRLAGIALS